MDVNPPPEFGWLRGVGYSSFAALGGVLGHMIRTLDKKEKINLPRAALEGVAAGFVGLIVLFTCDALGVGRQWTGVIVGVSGWLGPSATIRVLELLLRRKLNLQTKQEEQK